jgi:hypothetical protein
VDALAKAYNEVAADAAAVAKRAKAAPEVQPRRRENPRDTVNTRVGFKLKSQAP